MSSGTITRSIAAAVAISAVGDGDANDELSSALRRDAKSVATHLRRTGSHRMAAQVEALLASHSSQQGMLKRQQAEIKVLRMQVCPGSTCGQPGGSADA